MYQHINSTTAPKGEGKTVHVNYVNPYKAHPVILFVILLARTYRGE